MSARDELAEIVRLNQFSYVSGFQANEVADAILAAGYSKPRTISTVEELDEMADDSVVLDDMDGPLIKLGNWWHGSAVNLDSYSIIFPATVLYTPKES